MKNLITTAIFLFLTLQAFGQREIIDKVISIVGGELVLLSEVEDQYSLMKAEQGQLPEDARCFILNNILSSKLMLNQSKLDSIVVMDAEVEDQLNARVDRILSYMNNDISQFEAYYGQTVGQVKEQFREDLKNQILVQRMQGTIMDGVTVTPSEVKTFFKEIPIDSLPYFNSEVEIREIVYKPEINKEQRQKSIDKLQEIRTAILEKGESFEELAMKFSDDGSGRAGGDLGWAKRGKFVQEFEAAAYKLEEGEISEVVESEFGFHLIQLLERRGNSIHVRHILIKPEVTDEDLISAREHLDSVRTLIVNDSISFSLAVKRFSNEDQQSYNNDGRMVNPMTGNTFFEVGDLEPEIYFTIDTMDVNEISAPFEFKNQLGEPFFRIIEIQSRTVPHKANLRQDYSKIQEAAKQSKQNEYITGWVDEKVDATYIYLDPMYGGCPVLEKWTKKVQRP